MYTTTGYDATPCGTTAPKALQAPSFAQSGLKVNLTAGALELTGPEKIVLVDFDVTQSFGHQASGWVMHPVVTGAALETLP